MKTLPGKECPGRPARLAFALTSFLFGAVFVVSCKGLGGGGKTEPLEGGTPQGPPLSRITRVFKPSRGTEIDLGDMLDHLARKDVVFLGETHLDETTHGLEVFVYEELIKRRGEVVLALEMFERDVQPILDSYLAGRIGEAEFLEKARPWSNYRTGYRPMIEAAKRHGLPVVASNTPAAPRRKVAFGGEEAFNRLSPEDRTFFPEKLYPQPQEYWDRVARALRGHMGALFSGRTPEQLLYSSQSLWDNTMAESCVRALDDHPGALVLHVNGEFHSAFFQGTVHQLAMRRPSAKVGTVSVHAVDDLACATIAEEDRDRCDYFVYTESRARGYSDGFHAVDVSTPCRYRLHVPKDASATSPAPLLVYLSDDGLRAVDGLQFWKAVIGDRAAVAVLEAPHLESGDYLRLGGRWFSHETFFGDVGWAEQGIEKIVRYIGRYYPVSTDRIVIAGNGSGATLATIISILSGSMSGEALAFEPRLVRELGVLSLPRRAIAVEDDPLKLTIYSDPESVATWEKQLSDFVGVGCALEVKPSPRDGDPMKRMVDAVSRALGILESVGVLGDAIHTALVLNHDGPLARVWAKTIAGARAREFGGPVSVMSEEELEHWRESFLGEKLAIQRLSFRGEPFLGGIALEPSEGLMLVPEWSAADAESGVILPVATGSFGGTTLLWVPKGFSDAEKRAWKALEESQPIRKRSPFSSLRVVLEGEEELRVVLAELHAEGRHNVLIAPTVFCASPEMMNRLEREAKNVPIGMTVDWTPGLGERLFLLSSEPSGS